MNSAASSHDGKYFHRANDDRTRFLRLSTYRAGTFALPHSKRSRLGSAKMLPITGVFVKISSYGSNCIVLSTVYRLVILLVYHLIKIDIGREMN